MNQQEVSLLMAKATAAFPNSAPNLRKEPAIFQLWCEMLRDIDAQRALNNLNIHIMNSEFFPAIADIVRNDLQGLPDHEQQRQRTNEFLMLKESWHSEATPPPKHVLERWGRK